MNADEMESAIGEVSNVISTVVRSTVVTDEVGRPHMGRRGSMLTREE